ncbi:MAG: rhomboid family intramembrane serine protease [Treponema sp.]|jgi:membrane associated rhomboid family serine protease|nr:rhomboid family intramembrane serine protease [Treponema sp.]
MNFLRRPFSYRNDGVVFWIIGANILVFLADRFFERSLGRGFLVPLLAMIPELVKEGWVWTFLTYMFLHDGVSHIFFNMFALFLFGIQVERQMGSREFLLFYLLTGALAGLFSFGFYAATGDERVALMGASGAIFAVQLAYAVFFPDSIIYIWGILPLRAPVMVLGFTALEVFFMLTGRGGNVARFTHLAGFGFSWLYFLLRFGVNPWRRLTGRR